MALIYTTPHTNLWVSAGVHTLAKEVVLAASLIVIHQTINIIGIIAILNVNIASDGTLMTPLYPIPSLVPIRIAIKVPSRE